MLMNLIFGGQRSKLFFVVCVSLICDVTWSSNDNGERRRRDDTNNIDHANRGCRPLPPLENGLIINVTKPEDGIYPVDAVVIYSCNLHYVLLGEPSNHCIKQGRWSQRLSPECQKNSREMEVPLCPDPPEFDYLDINGLRNVYPVFSVVAYHCKYGSQVPKASILTCTMNGEWYPTKPSDNCATSPTEPPSRKDQLATLVINIVLYVSIALLLMFCVAVVINVRTRLQRRKQRIPPNGTFLGRSLNSSSDTNNLSSRIPDNYESSLVPSSPLITTNSNSGFQNFIPTAPPENATNQSSNHRPPSSVTLDGVDELPPSYEEVTSLRPPSFNSAQRLKRYQLTNTA